MAFEKSYPFGVLGRLFQSSLPIKEENIKGENRGVWEHDLLNWFNREGSDLKVEMEEKDNTVVYTRIDGGEKSQISLKKGRRGVEVGDNSRGIFYVEVLEKDYKDEKNEWFRDGLKGNPVETHVVSINNSGEKELVETLYPAA